MSTTEEHSTTPAALQDELAALLSRLEDAVDRAVATLAATRTETENPS